jgi:hypothetical protein
MTLNEKNKVVTIMKVQKLQTAENVARTGETGNALRMLDSNTNCKHSRGW